MFDVIVIGGGPAGATTARQLALDGFNVAVIEREQHPRFHIGESFLPRNFALIKQLGLHDRLRSIPQTRKLGAEFVMGHGGDRGTPIWFSKSLDASETEAFNIERAPFDAMLLDAAREAGAHVVQAQMKRIAKLEHGDVRVILDGGRELRASCMADASGQSTVVGRHLKTRAVLPHLRKVAYFGHFTNVERLPDDMAGFISIVMCSEGWFWLIPLDETRTSIGLVMDLDKSKQVEGVPADQMLRWGIERCPVVRERTRGAAFPESNHVTADFSYRCAPFAGPGYFLVGDAATFMDPIFSTGVCLAMMSGVQAAESIAQILRNPSSHAQHRAIRKRYCRYVEGSSRVFFWLVGNYYNHSFRELFLNGTGPMNVHGAVIGILAGHVFPRPAFALRWRLKLFELCMKLNAYLPLVPPREPHSLLAHRATPEHPSIAPCRGSHGEVDAFSHATASS